MRVLVTAGPTVEDIDDVRFISNKSSGRIGYAVAARFAVLGYQVTLVSGPVCLEPPSGVERVSVRSVDEMADAVWSRLPNTEVLVMAAAVADFKPARRIEGKIKKGGKGLTLHLVKTVDVLEGVGARRTPGQTIVGFALEAAGTNDAESKVSAVEKLTRKRLDAVVLNGPENIGARSGNIVILGKDGAEIARASGSKDELALVIVDAALRIHASKGSL